MLRHDRRNGRDRRQRRVGVLTLRATFHYQGEMLVGEATRVSNDERRGMASAYGPRGTFARCEYQMSTSRMGAGTCTFSNGAQYQVHIGS